MAALRLLVVGGTRFVGRHLVAEALRRGHDVTLLTRGRTNPDLFPEAERLRGDRRQGGLELLRGRPFDAVFDTCGYFPAEVRALASTVAPSVGQLTFVSSISVYPQPVAPGTDESAAVEVLDGPVPESGEPGEAYGALKALCERAAEDELPGRVLHVRPGLVVGPHDPTDRFTYWPRRIAEGGPVLAAERSQPVQLIDARDLAAFMLDLSEAGRTGVFNATGPTRATTMEQVLTACVAASGSDAEPVWAGEAFLAEQGVESWSELPLWVPAEFAGFLQVDASRARAAGLRFRPLTETVADTLAWDATRPPAERVDLLARERERELLRALGV